MRYRRIVAWMPVLLCVAAAGAQTPHQGRPPGPEKRLAYFDGAWRLEGSTTAASNHEVTFRTTEQNSWMAGGMFQLSRTTHTHAESLEQAERLAIRGYDPHAKVYTYDAFISTGEHETSRGTVDGDTWTWFAEWHEGDKLVKQRYIVKERSRDAYDFSTESAADGVHYTVTFTGKATRIK